MTRPSQQELIAEAAELARRYAWPLDAALDLEHRDRRLLLAAAGGALVPAVASAVAVGER